MFYLCSYRSNKFERRQGRHAEFGSKREKERNDAYTVNSNMKFLKKKNQKREMEGEKSVEISWFY